MHRDAKHSVCVIELGPERATVRRIRQFNPDGIDGEPCVFVDLLWSEHPSKKYEGDDFSASGQKEVRNHGVRVLAKFNQRFKHPKVGLGKQRKRSPKSPARASDSDSASCAPSPSRSRRRTRGCRAHHQAITIDRRRSSQI